MESWERRTLLRAGALAAVGWLSGMAAAETSVAEATTRLERAEPDRLLSVVSKSVPIEPLDYAPEDLVPWRGGPFELREEVAEQLEALFQAADEDGVGLRVISGFRSYDVQAGTYDFWVQQEGRARADLRSARPGHSEHQTGLAVDLDDTSGGCYLHSCFGETPAGQWLVAQAHRFGFVLSYPPGTVDKTGFAYEPWHFRYVGPRAAGRMHELEIALLQDYVSPYYVSAGIGRWLGRER